MLRSSVERESSVIWCRAEKKNLLFPTANGKSIFRGEDDDLPLLRLCFSPFDHSLHLTMSARVLYWFRTDLRLHGESFAPSIITKSSRS